MSIELKIKSKSLAVEARIIREEELKLRSTSRARGRKQLATDRLDRARESLYNHRTYVVRDEARATFLARAYLKQKPRSAVEATPTPHYIANRALSIAHRYSKGGFDADAFRAWIAA